MYRTRGDVLGEVSTRVMRIYRVCTCRHNYTYKEHTRRRQVTVAPACRTDSRRVLLDNAPVDGRTNRQTHIYRLLSCPRKKQGLRYRLRQHSIPIERRFLHDLHHLSYLLFYLLSHPLLFFDVLFLRRCIAPLFDPCFC